MSSTSPKDQSGLLSNASPPPREPHPGERLWTVRKGAHVLHMDLRDHGTTGAELQLFSRGELVDARMYTNRPIAVAEDAGWRRVFEANGWQE